MPMLEDLRGWECFPSSILRLILGVLLKVFPQVVKQANMNSLPPVYANMNRI